MLAPIRPMVSTTYARRGNRAVVQPTQEPQRSSSPLDDLSPSTEDVTIEEMSRRMKKRSRQVTGDSHAGLVSSGTPGGNIDKCSPLAKKSKQHSMRENDSLFDPTIDIQDTPSTPLRQRKRALLPLATQRIENSMFETPFPSDKSLVKSYAIPLADDPISPVPIGRQILSRTASRNLKENASRERAFRRSLASPFNSRPPSRSPSPVKSSHAAVNKALPPKSRTLSTISLKQDNIANVDQHSLAVMKDSLFDSTCAATSLSRISTQRTNNVVSHGRTASIPNVSSASGMLDFASAESWLVPAKPLTRSPQPHEDMHLDVFQADYPSFYFDQPVQASTPSRRKRQNTVTLKDAHKFNVPRPAPRSYYSDDSDAEVVNAELQDISRQSRRRRKTIVHMSSDSIFSSALDFSAYSDDSPMRGIKPPQSTAMMSLPLGATAEHSEFATPALDTAFSPAFGSAGLSHNNGSVTTSDMSLSHRISPRFFPTAVTPAPQTLTGGRPFPTRQHSASSEDKLYGIFSKLGLDECASTDQVADDSGVGLQSFSASSRPMRTSEMTHRRKRGDTIRAADFARPSVPEEAISPMQFSSRSAHADILPPNTRRTRSGTVTLTKNAGRSAAMGQAGGQGRPKVSRRPGGLPTIKMKIGSPLPQQAGDEEDDELLIKQDTVWRED